jgi:two-component system KDP operon response regulator KdpE
MGMANLILTIDDDPIFTQRLAERLSTFGYQSAATTEGRRGLELAEYLRPDLITFDINMNGVDGWAVCAQLRKLSRAPILIVASRHTLGDVTHALRIGADGFLSKPVGMRELLARIRALLRRAQTPGTPMSNIYKVRDLELDLDRRSVKVRGRAVNLSPIEFKLLEVLMRNAGQPVRHDLCLTEVWGPQYIGQINYLNLYVRYLRQKIERDPSNPEYILTTHRVGYRVANE